MAIISENVTNRDDSIVANQANGFINALTGYDAVKGIAGNNTLRREAGNDRRIGGNEDETLAWFNGDGSDRITSPLTWYPLSPLWQGGNEVVQQGLPHSDLAPAWQMLLLGNSSPTHHFQLLTGEPTEVDVIDTSLIGMDLDGAPSLIEAIPGPRLRRQVWLRTSSGQRLAYATSWWEATYVDEYLQNRSLPIWSSLAELRTELYRDVQGICRGHSPALELAFGHLGSLWGRYYLFWHQGHPLTLIYEVFSPYLTKYLGPMQINCQRIEDRAYEKCIG